MLEHVRYYQKQQLRDFWALGNGIIWPLMSTTMCTIGRLLLRWAFFYIRFLCCRCCMILNISCCCDPVLGGGALYTLTALLTFLRSLLPFFQGVVRLGSLFKDGDSKGLQSINSTVRFCMVPLSINRTNISIKHVHNLARSLISCLINGHLISSMFRNVCYLSTGKTLNKTGSVHVM
jgi:hypothetical protein